MMPALILLSLVGVGGPTPEKHPEELGLLPGHQWDHELAIDHTYLWLSPSMRF